MQKQKTNWRAGLADLFGVLVTILLPIFLLACCSYDEEECPRMDEYAVRLEENASHYARSCSDWHPEEAIRVIQAYDSGELLYGKYPITEEEYRNAIESLAKFYEYFSDSLYN